MMPSTPSRHSLGGSGSFADKTFGSIHDWLATEPVLEDYALTPSPPSASFSSTSLQHTAKSSTHTHAERSLGPISHRMSSGVVPFPRQVIQAPFPPPRKLAPAPARRDSFQDLSNRSSASLARLPSTVNLKQVAEHPNHHAKTLPSGNIWNTSTWPVSSDDEGHDSPPSSPTLRAGQRVLARAPSNRQSQPNPRLHPYQRPRQDVDTSKTRKPATKSTAATKVKSAAKVKLSDNEVKPATQHRATPQGSSVAHSSIRPKQPQRRSTRVKAVVTAVQQAAGRPEGKSTAPTSSGSTVAPSQETSNLASILMALRRQSSAEADPDAMSSREMRTQRRSLGIPVHLSEKSSSKSRVREAAPPRPQASQVVEHPAAPESPERVSLGLRSFPSSVSTARTDEFPGLYERFAVPSQLPEKVFQRVFGTSSSAKLPSSLRAIRQRSARKVTSGHSAEVLDPFDLYHPRYHRGTAMTKEGLCPICYDSQPNGMMSCWFKTKISAYLYHLVVQHGVSSHTGRPFDPPLEIREVSTGVATDSANERATMLQGHCHACRQWIDLQSVKSVDVKVKEIYWRKHAAKCHKGREMKVADKDIFVQDEFYRRVSAAIKEA